MLNDREREALREVEQLLTAQDPAFSRSFDEVRGGRSTWWLRRVRAMSRQARTAAILSLLALGVLMGSFGVPAGTLVVVALAALIALVARDRGGAQGRPGA